MFFLTPPVEIAPPQAVEVSELVPVRGGAPARLCPGDNALRVTLVRRAADSAGQAPPATPLRLSLVIPGGPAAGTLLAEGSVTVPAGAAATFTFLHVEIAERLRGRGARLVVRTAGAEHALAVDGATDWSCRPR